MTYEYLSPSGKISCNEEGYCSLCNILQASKQSLGEVPDRVSLDEEPDDGPLGKEPEEGPLGKEPEEGPLDNELEGPLDK